MSRLRGVDLSVFVKAAAVSLEPYTSYSPSADHGIGRP